MFFREEGQVSGAGAARSRGKRSAQPISRSKHLSGAREYPENQNGVPAAWSTANTPFGIFAGLAAMCRPYLDLTSVPVTVRVMAGEPPTPVIVKT